MPLSRLTRGYAGRLRDLFDAAAYSVVSLREVAGTEIPPPSYAPLHREVQHRTAGDYPFHLLVRWFYLGMPVAVGTAGRVLPAEAVSLLQDSGLLTQQGDALMPNALVTPCGDLWIASDLHQQRNSADGRFHVQPPGPVSLHLLNFMVRRPVSSALDLCSGVGLHAAAAAGFAERVVASDVNPRCEVFARFNATLNGRENVECVVGDVFEAVAGRRFGLIVCNPPFVVSPSVEFIYKDNPLELDEFCRRIVQTAPRHLEEGGICQIVCEWVEQEGVTWRERLRAWFAGTGCDAWVLEANRQLPDNYARGRLREHFTADEETGVEDWTAYFRERKVSAVHGGLIAMRRRTGDNWVSLDELRHPIPKPIGEAILRGLAARDFLQEHHADEQLFSTSPRVSENVRIHEELRWTQGGWQSDDLVLSVEDGVPVSIGIDATVKQVLERFDGSRTVDEVLLELVGETSLEVARARPQILALVRTMIENGCLMP